MRIFPTDLPGVMDLAADPHTDVRGRTIKTFEREVFEAAGLPTVFAEDLYTCSRRGVVRGMHFQTPPATQGKTVHCVGGSIFDVVLDLRRGSPTYLRTISRRLASDVCSGLYVPEGCAHGFCVLGKEAVVAYRLTTPFAAGRDAGVLWSSIGVEWPVDHPVVSERDSFLVPLSEFDTPFVFTQGFG
jgi:dTDP-4-dehydrorhamnose 3,5-epimerase